MTSRPRIVPLGDSALLVKLGDEIDITINRRVHALAALINLSPLDGLVETVPAYASLLIHYDPILLTYARICSWVREKFDHLESAPLRTPRQFEVPMRYGADSK